MCLDSSPILDKAEYGDEYNNDEKGKKGRKATTPKDTYKGPEMESFDYNLENFLDYGGKYYENYYDMNPYINMHPQCAWC